MLQFLVTVLVALFWFSMACESNHNNQNDQNSVLLSQPNTPSSKSKSKAKGYDEDQHHWTFNDVNYGDKGTGNTSKPRQTELYKDGTLVAMPTNETIWITRDGRYEDTLSLVRHKDMGEKIKLDICVCRDCEKLYHRYHNSVIAFLE